MQGATLRRPETHGDGLQKFSWIIGAGAGGIFRGRSSISLYSYYYASKPSRGDRENSSSPLAAKPVAKYND